MEHDILGQCTMEDISSEVIRFSIQAINKIGKSERQVVQYYPE